MIGRLDTSILDKRGCWVLFGLIMALALANAVDFAIGRPFWTLHSLINLGHDDNIPAWYSSILLFLAAVVSLDCALRAAAHKVIGRWHFLLFAGLLLLMSLDEIARLHEIFFGRAAEFLGVSDLSFAKHSAWVYLGGPLIVIVFGVFLIILRKPFSLVPGSFRLLLLGLGLIVLGGIVLESTINFLNKEELYWLWRLEIAVEDCVEMAGTVVVCHALGVWRDGIAAYPARVEGR